MPMTLTSGDIVKVKSLITSGMEMFADIDAHKESLKDMVSHVSDETNIPKPVLNKVIRLAYTGKFDEEREKFDDIESLLTVSGHATGSGNADNKDATAGDVAGALIGHNSKNKAESEDAGEGNDEDVDDEEFRNNAGA